MAVARRRAGYVLRLAGGRRRLRARSLRLGHRLLRPARVPQRRARNARLAAGARLDAPSACTSWSARSTGACLLALHRRFGAAAVTKAGALSLAAGILGWATVTAPWQLFLASAAERRGVGGDERGGAQCDRLAVVRALAARRARHGLQRRQHRRRHLLAALGGCHRRAGIPARGRRDRPLHGCHDVGAGRRGVLPHAAADGIDARRRCARERRRRPSRRRPRGRCPERCSGAIAGS